MRRIILWDYERGTWQYDVFCLLIIAFIFLTPKIWFSGKERDATPMAISNVKTEDFSSLKKKDQLKEEFSGNFKK
ncbi:MAG: hypothetical protein ACR2J3_05175 [Aridibacter sp.]